MGEDEIKNLAQQLVQEADDIYYTVANSCMSKGFDQNDFMRFPNYYMKAAKAFMNSIRGPLVELDKKIKEAKSDPNPPEYIHFSTKIKMPKEDDQESINRFLMTFEGMMSLVVFGNINFLRIHSKDIYENYKNEIREDFKKNLGINKDFTEESLLRSYVARASEIRQNIKAEIENYIDFYKETGVNIVSKKHENLQKEKMSYFNKMLKLSRELFIYSSLKSFKIPNKK